MPTIVETPNAASANSFLTLVEGQAYWDTRLFTDAWDNLPDQSAALILATRTISAMFAPRREFVRPNGSMDGYFIIHPTWTGLPATTTQSLPWGRTGMFDRNGNAIAANVIPQELKDATAELAGQMGLSDRYVDSDIAAQGITMVKAGSVAVEFSDKIGIQTLKVLPDIVMSLLVPSWLTDMTIESMYPALFDVIS